MANLKARTLDDVCTFAELCEAKHNTALQVKAGRVTLHKAEAQWIYEHKRYLMTSTAVYQPVYSVNIGFYFLRLLHTPGARYVPRGRFQALTAKGVNEVLGHEFLNA